MSKPIFMSLAEHQDFQDKWASNDYSIEDLYRVFSEDYDDLDPVEITEAVKYLDSQMKNLFLRINNVWRVGDA